MRAALLALLALPLAACVYVQEPAYAPYAYAPAVGPNAGTGAALGAVAGGLIGATAAGRHDRGAGIVGGAAAGALLGGLVGNGLDRQEAERTPPPYAAPYPAQPGDPLPYDAQRTWQEEPPESPYRRW
ncbi:glycine zipper domain-containing protein [Paracraurococcus lichenis]|uniref:Glycine zipper domain-containing protein n=1 Tax=Paracraurococcus lichenis TaxID=3064888 RepID=A0ABT9DSH5_9PROT|nr:glycine zipper domain-containing protein [Paracraurococcus sp. LOR1-02]MDO9706850.1 glycine zipper domain-containing protein [Paracraurococcus sp. LOR1-02]